MTSQPIGQSAVGTGAGCGRRSEDEALDPVFRGLAQLAAISCGAPLASIAIHECGEPWCATAAGVPAAAPWPDPFAECTARSMDLFEVPDAASGRALPRCRVRDRGAWRPCLRRLRAAQRRGRRAGYLGRLPHGAHSLDPQQRTAAAIARRASGGSGRASLANDGVDAAVRCADGRAADRRPDAAMAAALLESAPVAIYHTDAAGNMTYSNPEYRRIFGLQARAWPRCLGGARASRRSRAHGTGWAEFCRQPSPRRFDATAPWPTTARSAISRNKSSRPDGVPGWLGTIADFTDLVAARDDLRKAEITVPQHLRPGADRHRLCRPLRQVSALQPGVLHHAGLRRRRAREQDDRRAHARRRRGARGRRTRTPVERRASNSSDLEKRFMRKDGSVLWVRTTTALVRDGGAKPEYSVEFLRDITRPQGIGARNSNGCTSSS